MQRLGAADSSTLSESEAKSRGVLSGRLKIHSVSRPSGEGRNPGSA